jgi:hypothetical protein
MPRLMLMTSRWGRLSKPPTPFQSGLLPAKSSRWGRLAKSPRCETTTRRINVLFTLMSANTSEAVRTVTLDMGCVHWAGYLGVW